MKELCSIDEEDCIKLTEILTGGMNDKVLYKQFLQYIDGISISEEQKCFNVEVIEKIKSIGISKEEIFNKFKAYDTLNKGVVTLDTLCLVLMKISNNISNKEICALAKEIDQNVEKTEEINYIQFINKIFS